MLHNMSTLTDYYNYYVYEYSDPRTSGWPFLESPIPVLGVILIYCTLIYGIVPKYMEKRKPFELKTILFYYNIYQIIACSMIIYGCIGSLSLRCTSVDYSTSAKAMRELKFLYFTFFVKLTELAETVFFALRKKDRQISKLHVYHHISSLLISWFTVRYIGGGMVVFAPILNSFVHVVMYFYYLLSSFGPSWQKVLTPWKPKITMMQLVQFLLLFVYYLQALAPSCQAPKAFLIIFYPNVFLVALMFMNFYRVNYLKKASQKTN